MESRNGRDQGPNEGSWTGLDTIFGVLIIFLLYPGSIVEGGSLRSTLFAVGLVFALLGAVSMSVILVRE